jgi:hypothetical protein
VLPFHKLQVLNLEHLERQPAADQSIDKKLFERGSTVSRQVATQRRNHGFDEHTRRQIAARPTIYPEIEGSREEAAGQLQSHRVCGGRKQLAEVGRRLPIAPLRSIDKSTQPANGATAFPLTWDFQRLAANVRVGGRGGSRPLPDCVRKVGATRHDDAEIRRLPA